VSAPTEVAALVPNEDRGPRQRYDIRPHGTEARSRRHRRYGEKPARPAWPLTTAPTPTGRPCGPQAPMYCRSQLRRLAMPEGQAPRRNSKGHPCPPWCTVDHGELVGSFPLTYHGTRTPVIETPSGYVNASAYHEGFGDAPPQIALTCLAPGGALLVDAGDSGKLAALVEQLAGATPDQHRELAAAIRQAAAVITEGEGDR